MIDWAGRAKAEFLRSGAGVTDKTDESRVSSVSSVGVYSVLEKRIGSIGVAATMPRRSGNPYMTPEQGDACHEGGWDDREIETFMAMSDRFERIGRPDAEHLAERLVLRNRDADDRHMCIECLKLESSDLCRAAASAGRRFEPIPNILMRCVDFSARAFTSR